MSQEPIFIRQIDNPPTSDEQHAWIESCVSEANREGVTFSRCSYDPYYDQLLFEGWKQRPDDQGEPRFTMAPK